jgi:hypothetical protein
MFMHEMYAVTPSAAMRSTTILSGTPQSELRPRFEFAFLKPTDLTTARTAMT